MNGEQPVPAADLRGFRWPLQPLQQKLRAEAEVASLALARLQRESLDLARSASRCLAHQREQEALALQSAQRDVLAGARAMRYLAAVEAERIAAKDASEEHAQRLEAACIACAQRLRQLESLDALREKAQREHVQAGLRRAWKEADAAWLALAQVRRAAARRESQERQ